MEPSYDPTKSPKDPPKTTILQTLGSFYPRHMTIFELEPIQLKFTCLPLPT